ncbi:hypothetical protein HK405_013848 [Cladochytrium tenue]|nr:hypothetical protein HK405_013848 [Cladochytrium tenue]
MTDDDIRKCLEIAKKYSVATASVKPYVVSWVTKELEGTDVLVCPVIGFPHDNNTTQIKVTEVQLAVESQVDSGDERLWRLVVFDRYYRGRSGGLCSLLAMKRLAAANGRDPSHRKQQGPSLWVESCRFPQTISSQTRFVVDEPVQPGDELAPLLLERRGGPSPSGDYKSIESLEGKWTAATWNEFFHMIFVYHDGSCVVDFESLGSLLWKRFENPRT